MVQLKQTNAPKPTFIIAGAARAGTTSLYNWFNQHPQVYMPPIKETNHFARLKPPFTGPGDVELSLPLARKPDGAFEERFAAIVSDWYEYLALFANTESYKARGEVSPSYLYCPGVAQNIYAALPNIKIIIVLRNPIERAFSHYKVLVSWGRETESLTAALQNEDKRLADGWEWCWALKGAGLYYKPVKQFFETFSRERVGIWLYEDLSQNPEKVYQELCKFIGVEPFPLSLERENASHAEVGSVKRFLNRHTGLQQTIRKLLPASIRASLRQADGRLSGEKMVLDSQTKAELKAYFQEDIVRLQKLLPEYPILNWLEE